MGNMRFGTYICLLLTWLCIYACFISIISCRFDIYKLVIMRNLLYIEGFSIISGGAVGFQVTYS